jgi:hypothetical protein
MEACGQIQSPSSFTQFFDFMEKENILPLPGIEDQIYKFIPMLFRVRKLLKIYFISTFVRMNKMERILCTP